MKRTTPNHGSKGLLAVLLALAALSPATASDARQTAAEPVTVQHAQLPAGTHPLHVNAFGRTALTPDGMYHYQWPGVYFTMAYQGSALYFNLGPGDQDVHVWVDGQMLPPLVKPSPGTYRIATGNGGNHAVRIELVNENQDAPKSIGEFSLDSTSHALPVTVPTRQMEFIGDSHTVGYGNVSTSRDCTTDQVWSTTDTSQSVGADTAAHYGASYRIAAISGHGVVRNYGGAAGDPVPVAYPYLLLDKQQRYVDPAWSPSVLVISLGTNDFSTALKPEERWKTRDALHADFEQTYAQFLENLRKSHPGALIVLWATDMSDGEIAAEGAKVVQQRNAQGDPRVKFVEVTGLEFKGCHFHPSAADDQTIAGRLIPVIDSNVHW